MRIAVVLFLLISIGHCCLAKEPLKVYLLAGQSNMVGDGSAITFEAIGDDPNTRPLYEKMFDEKGQPKVCERVWISYLNGKMKDVGEVVTGQLTAGFGRRIYYIERFAPFIGPEFAFGVTMEKAHQGPVLLIKVGWGGQSLHTDFRPPSVNSDEGGKRYQQMIAHTKEVLDNIKSVIPEYDETAGYELAGFAWFQGWNDLVDKKEYPVELGDKRFDRYGRLLEKLIDDVRLDLNAPDLPVAIGVMGVHGNFREGTFPNLAGINEQMNLFRKAMAYPADLPKFKSTVKAVDTVPFWDEKLAGISVKKSKVKSLRKRLAKKAKGSANENGKMSPEQQKLYTENYEKELLNEDELSYWSRNASVGGFVHYFGSAKFYSQTGEALAKALLSLDAAR